MSRQLVALLEAKIVQHTITATRPTLVTDGVDIMSWRTNGEYSGAAAALFLDGTVGATLNSPTGGLNGAELWGYRLSQWWRLSYINDGVAVELAGNLQGFAQQLDIIGVFERLCISGTVSGGTAIAKLAPIDAWETA